MTLLDLLFKRIESQGELSEILDYKYWTLDNDGCCFIARRKLDKTISVNDIELNWAGYIDHTWKYRGENGGFVPYEELEFLSKIEIEMRGKLRYERCQKYPLVCIRGECSSSCTNKEVKTYCFNTPCSNGHLNYNGWSGKYPEFTDFLFDVVNWIKECSHTNMFIVMFDFTPNEHERELDFRFVVVAVLVKGTKITFITEAAEIERVYEEYNTRYPMKDYLEISKGNGDTFKFSF